MYVSSPAAAPGVTLASQYLIPTALRRPARQPLSASISTSTSTTVSSTASSSPPLCPNPSYNTCDATITCGIGNVGFTHCTCGTTTEGENVCYNSDTFPCALATVATCTTTKDCGTAEVCVADSCCGNRNACIPSPDTDCLLPPAITTTTSALTSATSSTTASTTVTTSSTAPAPVCTNPQGYSGNSPSCGTGVTAGRLCGTTIDGANVCFHQNSLTCDDGYRPCSSYYPCPAGQMCIVDSAFCTFNACAPIDQSICQLTASTQTAY